MEIGRKVTKLPNRFVVKRQQGKYRKIVDSLNSLSAGEYLPVKFGADEDPMTCRASLYNYYRKSNLKLRSAIDPEDEYTMVFWLEKQE